MFYQLQRLPNPHHLADGLQNEAISTLLVGEAEDRGKEVESKGKSYSGKDSVDSEKERLLYSSREPT